MYRRVRGWCHPRTRQAGYDPRMRKLLLTTVVFGIVFDLQIDVQGGVGFRVYF
jgi:hypothetical protein